MEADNPFQNHESTKSDEDDEESERAKKKKRAKRRSEEAHKEAESAAETGKKAEEDRASLFGVLFADEAPDKKQPKKTESTREEDKDKGEDAAAEKEASPELTESERRAAVEAYIERRQQELTRTAETQEKAESEEGTPDDAEPEEKAPEAEPEATTANRTFLRRLADKLRRTEQPPNEAMYQAAAAETIAEAPSRASETIPEAADSSDFSHDLHQDPTQTEASFSSPRPGSETPLATSVESQAPHRDEEPESTRLAAGAGPAYRVGPGGAGQNFIPKSETTTPAREAYRYEKPTGAGEFLLGGVIGYLFGRHRGRRQERAEHKPAHQALEQEVGRLESTIQSYEQLVRNTARRQEQTSAATPQPSPEAVSPSSLSQPEQATPENAPRRPAGESDKRPTEGSPLDSQPEQPAAPRPELVNKQPTAETITAAPLQEVLAVAREIRYPDGKRLNDLFEQKRLDEPALREVVKAYLRGEKHEKLLKQFIDSSAEKQPVTPEILQSSRAHTEARSDVAAPQQSQMPPAPAENPLPAPYLYTTKSRDTTSSAATRHNVGQISPLRQLGLGILTGLGVILIASIIVWLIF